MSSQLKKPAIGVTLVEMMIVLAIVAILAAMMSPDLRTFFVNVRLTTAYDELAAALNLARSEAIRRGAPVSVRRVSATAQKWTDGWQVIVDPDRDGNCSGNPCPAAELIREGQPLASSLTVYSSVPIDRFVPFNPDGRIPLNIDGVDIPQALFIVCYIVDGQPVIREGTRSRSRALLLSGSGRVRPGADQDGDGQPENENGGQITSCS